MLVKKLVRDKIPELMQQLGKKGKWYQAKKSDVTPLLKEKLQEEVKEFLLDDTLEELADIQEVLLALLKETGATKKQLEQIRLKKKKERGGFAKSYVAEFIK